MTDGNNQFNNLQLSNLNLENQRQLMIHEKFYKKLLVFFSPLPVKLPPSLIVHMSERQIFG